MTQLMTVEHALAEAAVSYVRDMPDPYAALSAPELAAFHLLGQGHTHDTAARLLGVTAHTVGRRELAIARKLRLADHDDLVRAYEATMRSRDRTPARFLAERVLPHLAGGTILCPFLRDEDWCGLVIRLPTGRTVSMWLLEGEDADRSGWVTID